MDARIDNWDDLRLFLAVARAGTLSGAAREIGVNHSTVFRRIGAFEEALGVRLFDRLPSGYALTAAGEAMQESALRVEEEIAALDRRVTGQDLRLSGIVRITTVDMLAQGLLPRHLLAFRRAYPGIEIELTVGNATLNLTRREADVALRVGNQPPETLVGRRVGRLVFAVYGANADGATEPLTGQPWIGFDAEHAPLVRAFAEFLPDVRPAFRVNSVAAAIAAARAGLGLATLPCGVADLEPELRRIAPLPESFTLDLWLLTHEDLRRTARIRAFLDFMAEALAQEAPLLEGTA
ncbi:LysR family transcriptional regulator [Paracoccus sp. MC1862]|uniref:LysR family transcriptional regulator n=1 Tax=Paracoccus sp. MC1862 TaxID=2760307 RepID=UPI0016034DF1|nr:LysR family transcriptional regulator [Paracoccus sp. MC1862]MBB1498121.1 LysR family transcriptional regulator [Paracoccus sp. MC1862]QQO46197.1 LysR family transcriptional regulator [Paracoccus sp. MC1862]